jgi:hypothetical protein
MGVVVDDVREVPERERRLYPYDAEGRPTRWKPAPDGQPRTVSVRGSYAYRSTQNGQEMAGRTD